MTERPNPDTATRARYADLIEQLQSYSDRSCHAAATLIADLCDIIDRLTQWKAEGTEVIESWELVYDALGDVGGLGQRRSDAVLAEVLRMKAELDQRTNPDLATLLVKNADRYDKRFGWETPMGEQMRAAARMIGDTP